MSKRSKKNKTDTVPVDELYAGFANLLIACLIVGGVVLTLLLTSIALASTTSSEHFSNSSYGNELRLSERDGPGNGGRSGGRDSLGTAGNSGGGNVGR